MFKVYRYVLTEFCSQIAGLQKSVYEVLTFDLVKKLWLLLLKVSQTLEYQTREKYNKKTKWLTTLKYIRYIVQV